MLYILYIVALYCYSSCSLVFVLLCQFSIVLGKAGRVGLFSLLTHKEGSVVSTILQLPIIALGCYLLDLISIGWVCLWEGGSWKIHVDFMVYPGEDLYFSHLGAIPPLHFKTIKRNFTKNNFSKKYLKNIVQ